MGVGWGVVIVVLVVLGSSRSALQDRGGGNALGAYAFGFFWGLVGEDWVVLVGDGRGEEKLVMAYVLLSCALLWLLLANQTSQGTPWSLLCPAARGSALNSRYRSTILDIFMLYA